MTVFTAVRTTVAAALIILPLAGAATAVAATQVPSATTHISAESVPVLPADTPWGPDGCACGSGS